MEVKKAMGVKQYQAYCKVIKNAIIPDFNILLFKSEAELEDMRSQVKKLSEISEWMFIFNVV